MSGVSLWGAGCGAGRSVLLMALLYAGIRAGASPKGHGLDGAG
nr:MAG TPA: hypothetical protein [Caudoviricetes sp.]